MSEEKPDAPFRFLNKTEFAALSSRDKLAYLKRAVEEWARQRARSSGPPDAPPKK